ncbi:hypothetical protein Tco_1280136 [Tanacetum coccineum]
MICRRCGSVGVIRTSWTSTNPGRRFFGCSKRGTNCGIIDWYDPPMCDRAVQIIPGLLRRINHLQQTLADYVDQIVDYQGENDEAVADQNHVDYQMQARRMKWFQLYALSNIYVLPSIVTSCYHRYALSNIYVQLLEMFLAMQVKLEFLNNSKSSPRQSKNHNHDSFVSPSTTAYAKGYIPLFGSTPTAVKICPGYGPDKKQPSSPNRSLLPALNPFFKAPKQI